MMDEEWYHDDYIALDEEEVFLNTIWEECTADLRSKSTVDFTSFSSDFTSFSNSISSAHHLFDRQDSENSLLSTKSNSSSTSRLRVYREEDDTACTSSSSLPADETKDELDAPVTVRMTRDNHDNHDIPSNDLNEEPTVYEFDIFTSPTVSSHKSSQTTELLNHPHHQSPRSPMELMLQTTTKAMEKPTTTIYTTAITSHSKRVDFSGAVVIEHQNHRQVKRERIRSKMKAIEDKVVEARRFLNSSHTATNAVLVVGDNN